MQLRWTPRSLKDIDDIQTYVSGDSPRNAYHLVSRIRERVVADLPANPWIGRVGRDPETRELVVPGTSYIVVYRVGQAIEILAVIHGARDWPKRF